MLEIVLLKNLRLQQRGARLSRPDACENQRKNGGCEKRYDKVALEPVFPLAFVKDDFQRAESQRDQADSNVINSQLAALAGRLDLLNKLWRIRDQPAGQQQAQNANRHIDKEDPTPGKVVGDPA